MNWKERMMEVQWSYLRSWQMRQRTEKCGDGDEQWRPMVVLPVTHSTTLEIGLGF
jgi:hypothetical protein